jgi:aconitate hydratase
LITDPRELPDRLGIAYPELELPEQTHVNTSMLVAPLESAEARTEELVRGPNIVSLPEFDPLPGRIEAPVELKVGDNISTDEILPAGARVLPLRSNIPAISEFVFSQVDDGYARIHWQNLANFGILPLQFTDPKDYDDLEQGDVIELSDLPGQLAPGQPVTATVPSGHRELRLAHQLSERQIEMVLAGGRIPLASSGRHKNQD